MIKVTVKTFMLLIVGSCFLSNPLLKIIADDTGHVFGYPFSSPTNISSPVDFFNCTALPNDNTPPVDPNCKTKTYTQDGECADYQCIAKNTYSMEFQKYIYWIFSTDWQKFNTKSANVTLEDQSPANTTFVLATNGQGPASILTSNNINITVSSAANFDSCLNGGQEIDYTVTLNIPGQYSGKQFIYKLTASENNSLQESGTATYQCSYNQAGLIEQCYNLHSEIKDYGHDALICYGGPT